MRIGRQGGTVASVQISHTQSSPPRVLSKEQPGTPAGPSSFSRDFTVRKIGRAHCPAHRLCLVKKRQEKREDADRTPVGKEDDVRRVRAPPRDPPRRRGEELHRPDPHPGEGDPHRARGEGPDRLRADRHRQDGRLRAPDPAPPPGNALERDGAAAHPRPRADADAGAGLPDRGELRRRTAGTRPSSTPSSSAASTRARSRRPSGGGSTSSSPRPDASSTSWRRASSQLRTVETFVLDEADRMLDMGFIHDVRRIIAQLPAKRQTLLLLGDHAARDPGARRRPSFATRSGSP